MPDSCNASLLKCGMVVWLDGLLKVGADRSAAAVDAFLAVYDADGQAASAVAPVERKSDKREEAECDEELLEAFAP